MRNFDSKLWNLLNYFLGVAFLTAVSGCQSEKSDAANSPQRPAPAVTVVPVVHEEVVRTHELVGRTAAQKTVNLVARVQGYLEKRNFKEGEDVEKGDLLFVIEQAPYQIEVKADEAKVTEAKATLQNAESYLNRLKTVRKGGVSQTDLDKAESDFLKAQAQLMNARAVLDQAKLNLSYTEVRSPIDGRIGRVSVNVGNLVSPASGTLATIVQMDPIYVLFTVSSADVLTEFQSQIKKGQATTFTPHIQLPNGTMYPFEGVEDFVSHIVDDKTGTITIRAVFQNKGNNVLPGKANIPHNLRLLLPGQFVKVLVKRDDIRTEKVIPQIAIQHDQAGKFVLVVDAENRVQKRYVDVGEKHGVNWIVKEGLEVGERVISEGLQKVRPGITVQTAQSPSGEK
ncbi:MAG: hemolysin secretion protein D [Nitrospinaceae bacterium]|nr:MAG: hemolysin secretion protein D [Nitrospinaceae bacterium]